MIISIEQQKKYHKYFFRGAKKIVDQDSFTAWCSIQKKAGKIF